MSRVLLINAAEPEETRAALVVEGRVEEFHTERAAAVTQVGNIYRGKVVNLETGIGAAFVNIGVGRNAFLHVSDCVGVGADEDARIDDHARVGDEFLVQVTRDSIGSKGPVLTAQVSIPGRFLVLLPFSEAGGVSRRIDESHGRAKLRELAKDLERRVGMGLILRTASADRSEPELVKDLKSLTRIWEAIHRQSEETAAPALIYAERDLVARALRDLLSREVDEIVVDTPEALRSAEETLERIHPELGGRLRIHDSNTPLFHEFGIETLIDRLHARRVPLPGGGSIVFDTTEALVAVDVNSGRMRHENGLEETALQTNLEAAEEIARQLRLRDLGGVVVVDFIDMRESAHVREVERAFKAHLRADRARLRPSRIGAFGIFVLTRQRTGAGAGDGHRTCWRCGGSGAVIRTEEVALRVFRELMARASRTSRLGLRALTSAEVAEALQATRAPALRALSEESGRPIVVEADPTLPPDGWRVETLRAP